MAEYNLNQPYYPTREQFLKDMDCTKEPVLIGGGTFGSVFKMHCMIDEK